MLMKNFKIDCSKCFGLCCICLYFMKSDGFPYDKPAGKPCNNLQKDFKCGIHNDLRKKGLKGCSSYDCFGAGQQVSQLTYKGEPWQLNTPSSKEMFDVFLIMKDLQEMLFYLNQGLTFEIGDTLKVSLLELIARTQELTNLDAASILKLDLSKPHGEVKNMLLTISETVRDINLKNCNHTLKGYKSIGGRLDLAGKDLRKLNLKGASLRGAFLMAANLRDTDLSFADLIGADLRDADFSGANLTNSMFLTQAQINTAKGNSATMLPPHLCLPSHWNN